MTISTRIVAKSNRFPTAHTDMLIVPSFADTYPYRRRISLFTCPPPEPLSYVRFPRNVAKAPLRNFMMPLLSMAPPACAPASHQQVSTPKQRRCVSGLTKSVEVYERVVTNSEIHCRHRSTRLFRVRFGQVSAPMYTHTSLGFYSPS